MSLKKIEQFFFPSVAWKQLFFACLTILMGLVVLSFFLIFRFYFSSISATLPKEKGVQGKEFLNLDAIQVGNRYDKMPLELLMQEFELKTIYVKPDEHYLKKAKLFIKNLKKEREIEDQKPLYLYFDDLGFVKISEEKSCSSLKMVPQIEANQVIFHLCFIDEKKEEEGPGRSFILSSSNPLLDQEKAKQALSSLTIQLPDLFLSAYSHQKKGRVILTDSHQNEVLLQVGEKIGFDGERLVSIENGDFWIVCERCEKNFARLALFDRSGYGCYDQDFSVKSENKSEWGRLEEPKQVKKRGHATISCLFQGKLVKMRKGDFFFKTDGHWKKVNSLEEFNALIEYKIQGEVFVVEDLFIDEEKIRLVGKLFDHSRWNESRVDWVFHHKKEKNLKDPPRRGIETQQNEMERIDQFDPDEDDLF